MLFSEALKGYWLDKKLELSKATIRNYTYALNVFKEFIADKDIFTITVIDIKSFILYLTDERKVSKRTASTQYVVLASFFKWAETELSLVNPMTKIKKPSYVTQKVECFTLTEVDQLLKAKQPERIKTIQMLLLDTGLRVSELCNLKVTDYDSKNGRLYIRNGKGSKDRIVYLGQKTQKLLWKLLIKKTEGYLFASRTGKPVHRNNVLKALKKVALPLKIKAHPHKYRHTFAVNFLRNGGNIKQLQEIMGHSNLRTLEIYLSLAEIDLEQSRSYSPIDNLK